jgi:hypothetical protein
MGDTLAQDRFAMPEPFLGPQQFRLKLLEIVSAKVLEFTPLEQIPHAFLRVEFGRIARQAFQVNASGSSLCQEILDGLRAMDTRPVPDDQQLARDLTQKQLQEAHHIRSFEGMLLDVHDQASVARQAPDGREMIARQRDFQNRCLPHRSIGAHHHGQQVKARLVYKDDRALFLCGLFFSSTARWSRHRWIAASSRWVARLSGFCLLCLILCRRREQWVG